jgi:pimeloyl-ACP methyl ester carboxylesterase
MAYRPRRGDRRRCRTLGFRRRRTLWFCSPPAEVALGHVGIVLGRLARNNAEWHRLIDLAGLSDTLIGDADGIYYPALFNDRLLLGLKGTMSEAELYVLRARLNGGIRNKAARSELRRGLPVGFVWGEEDGEVRFHPDEAVVATIRSSCVTAAKFAGSTRATRLSTMYSPTPSMPALTPLAKRGRRRRRMQRERARSALDVYRGPSGKCSLKIIIPG